MQQSHGLFAIAKLLVCCSHCSNTNLLYLKKSKCAFRCTSLVSLIKSISPAGYDSVCLCVRPYVLGIWVMWPFARSSHVRAILLFNQPPGLTQPGHPYWVKWVPAKAVGKTGTYSCLSVVYLVFCWALRKRRSALLYGATKFLCVKNFSGKVTGPCTNGW